MEDLFDDLIYDLRKKKKNDQSFLFSSNFNDTFQKEKITNEKETLKVDPNLVEFYELISDGIQLNWNLKQNNEIGGQLHFLTMEEILKDWKGKLFDEDDISENDLIQYFHPFDLITPEAQCGIMLGMGYEDLEIYYNFSSSSDTEGLDLDFAGYLEMSREARVFFYWPKVLLDIQNEEESPETEKFKTHMPEIFQDFSWNNFKSRYESLRLSRRK